MKSRHSAFIALFLVASVSACVVLPYSVVSYIDVCKTGYGAELDVETAHLNTSSIIDILVLEFRYSSPDRLETRPGAYWMNITVNEEIVSLAGTINKIFARGLSDIDTVSAPLTAEQSAALANDASIVVHYWIWVDVPDRGSGSALTRSQSVPLEVS